MDSGNNPELAAGVSSRGQPNLPYERARGFYVVVIFQ